MVRKGVCGLKSEKRGYAGSNVWKGVCGLSGEESGICGLKRGMRAQMLEKWYVGPVVRKSEEMGIMQAQR